MKKSETIADGKLSSSIVMLPHSSAAQCNWDCTDLYIGETKHPLCKLMARHGGGATPQVKTLLSAYI